MSSVFKDFVKPILVLVVICLVISAALGFTNQLTEPIITAAEEAAAAEALIEVLPDADSFEALDTAGMPETIIAAYRAANGAGFAFQLEFAGYGGTITMMCGINSDGLITDTKVLSHAETPSVGSKITESPFMDQFVGADSSLSGVDTISGATISSEAFIGAVNDAFTAYSFAEGVQ